MNLKWNNLIKNINNEIVDYNSVIDYYLNFSGNKLCILYEELLNDKMTSVNKLCTFLNIQNNKSLEKLNYLYDLSSKGKGRSWGGCNSKSTDCYYNLLNAEQKHIFNEIIKPCKKLYTKLITNHNKQQYYFYLDKQIYKYNYIMNYINNSFYMITTTYNNIKSIRLEETIYSINKNLENDLIEKYFILLEVELTNEDENLYDTYLDKNNNFKGKIKDEFITLLQNPKIEIYLIKNRSTYQSIFDFCNNYHNIIWILTNSDIHFPEWNNHNLKLLLDRDYDIETFVLTRYNIYDDLTEKIKTSQKGVCFEKNNIKYRTQHKTGSSIDSWIFKTPINIKKMNLNFDIGKPECDGRMNFQLSKIRKVINPCLDIISIHKHTNWGPESYNKVIYKDNIYTRKEFNKILDSIGLKRIAIPFSKLKRPIKIAHLINPFKCSEDNPSYLYYAQPITFKSMHNAQLEAQKIGIDVKLYAVNYPEDDEIIPDYFIKLPHLEKSTLSEFPKISHNRKLPIIQEMFDSILQNSDADYIIFTNSDIGVQKRFYKKINEFIHKDNLKSFIINRRDNIPKFKDEKRLTEKDLDIIYKESGQTHPGKDCFIMHRKILEKINMNLMFTGYPPWGNKLHKCMKKIDKKTHLYRDKYLTFHLGCDTSWKKKVKSELWSKNIEISKKI